jgi:hypothetical protein
MSIRDSWYGTVVSCLRHNNYTGWTDHPYTVASSSLIGFAPKVGCDPAMAIINVKHIETSKGPQSQQKDIVNTHVIDNKFGDFEKPGDDRGHSILVGSRGTYPK